MGDELIVGANLFATNTYHLHPLIPMPLPPAASEPRVMSSNRNSPIGYQALRRGRWSTPGYRYLVTFTTMRRAARFADPIAGQAVASAMANPDAWAGAELAAWVLMPDHAHVVLALSAKSELSGVVKCAKARMAMACNRAVCTTGSVWAKGFHDRGLRTDAEWRAAVRYVLFNPVRAGMVVAPENYPWLGCSGRRE